MAEVVHLMTDQETPEFRMDSPEADVAYIRSTANYVNGQIRGMKAAWVWVECGRVLAEMKGNLTKAHKGDNSRVGWLKAFEIGQFPFSRQHAENLIRINGFFGASVLAPNGLPSSTRALLAIAKHFKSKRRQTLLGECLADGRITIGTTETEVNALAKSLSLTKPRKKPDPFIAARKRYIGRVQNYTKKAKLTALRELLVELGVKPEDLADV